MDGVLILACVLFDYEFAKGSKVKLLRREEKRREGRNIMIAVELFIRIPQPYFKVFRKKWQEIWKMLMRCCISNLNLRLVKTEKY